MSEPRFSHTQIYHAIQRRDQQEEGGSFKQMDCNYCGACQDTGELTKLGM